MSEEREKSLGKAMAVWNIDTVNNIARMLGTAHPPAAAPSRFKKVSGILAHGCSMKLMKSL